MYTEHHTQRVLGSASWWASRPRLESRRLILAEDDLEMRQLLAQALRRAGFDVIEVADGDALRTLVRSEILHVDPARADGTSQIAAIVSDLRMPGVSGLAVLSELRAGACSLPFILLTAFGDAETHEEARRLGAFMFDKPFEIDDLLTAIVCMGGN